MATVASQQSYQIPNSIRKITDLYVTVGSMTYYPSFVGTPEDWKMIIASKLGTSDVPLYWYREVNKVYFAATRACSSNTITFRGRKRIAANIPLPGVDTSQLKAFFENNQLFGMMNMFSGGGLSNISIVLLGVGPYITASIIMQLLTMIFPQLEKMQKEEGEAGKQKFNMWTRWGTVPLAGLQTFAMINMLKSQQVLGEIGSYEMAVILIVATAGTVFLMWLGELITEKGIGNGVSLIIFAGIVASLPGAVSRVMTTEMKPVKALTGDAIYREYDEYLKFGMQNGCDIVNCDSSHLFAVSRDVGIQSTECGVLSDVAQGSGEEWESTLSGMLSADDRTAQDPMALAGRIVEFYAEVLIPELIQN